MPVSSQGPILIVDDSSDQREAMGTLLTLRGYAVETAENGDDALRRLNDGLAPCLIILDLMMPGKDGFAFRQEQRANPDLAMIPVLVYSAYHNVRYAALEMGVVGYFQKPVEVETLLDLVAKYRYRDDQNQKRKELP